MSYSEYLCGNTAIPRDSLLPDLAYLLKTVAKDTDGNEYINSADLPRLLNSKEKMTVIHKAREQKKYEIDSLRRKARDTEKDYDNEQY